MAPNKFVAPVKKNGCESFSVSSKLSSSYSNFGAKQDTKSWASSSTAGIISQTAPSSNMQSKADKTSFKGPQILKNQPKRPLFAGPKIMESSPTVTEPPKKLKRVETVKARSAPQKTNRVCFNDGDKENRKPVDTSTKKNISVQKNPHVSLTDDQYDLIFKSVLEKYQANENEGKEPTLNAEKAKDETAQLHESFQLSQSDLEDEIVDTGNSCAKNNISNVISLDNMNIHNSDSNNVTNGSDRSESQAVISNPEAAGGSGKDVCEKSNLSQTAHKPCSQHSSLAAVPSSPCITYMCHVSQPEPDRTRIPKFNEMSSKTNSQDKITKIHSTISDSVLKTPVIRDNIKVAPSPGPSPLQTKSANSFKSVTEDASLSVKIPEILLTPVVTPSRPRSQLLVTPGSSSSRRSSFTAAHLSQQSKSPPANPHGSQTFPITQEPQTPILASNPLPTMTRTPQSAVSTRGSPTPSTPLGSQQLIQEIQRTPPPPGLSARERLKWLYQKRMAGVWVQCDQAQCGKWRYLPDCHDPSTLPKYWQCSMNPDQSFNSCNTEEKRLNLQEEEDMIFNKYSPGSLVWVKLSGYPWWPAMVEDDPDLEQFYWLNLFSDIPTWYHVVFFDDADKPKSRAWIQVERMQEFTTKPLIDESPELVGFKKRVIAASHKAEEAKSLSPKERLMQYGFAASYKGPIGGPSKTKYKGKLGFREPIRN